MKLGTFLDSRTFGAREVGIDSVKLGTFLDSRTFGSIASINQFF